MPQGLWRSPFVRPAFFLAIAIAFTTLRCMLHRQGDLVFSTSVRANAGHHFCLFTGRFGITPWGVAQMLKWERADLLFVEKSNIFAIAKEETVRSRRLPPFLGPACGQNYPAFGQNYKALGFIYVLFGEKHKALGGNAPAGDRKNPAQNDPLGKFMLNLLMHFDALCPDTDCASEV
ncbi:MAG: hypothetical protein PUD40_06040 [Bacteroidales bacterium]|nr:hypothetical protein [Bacteroidales bacterium]